MKASIKIFSNTYKSEGDTPLEALSNLKVTGFVKAKGILTVGERTIVLTPFQTQRLFSQNKLMRELALKATATRF